MGSDKFLPGGLVHLEKDGSHLYIDGYAPNWISTNHSGHEVMRLLLHHSIPDTAAMLGKEWGMPAKEALDHVQCFRKELFEHEFNLKPLEQSPHYPGRSKVLECGELQELWIYTNNTCNLRCGHCFISAGEKKKDELTYDELKDVIDEALSLGVYRFYFTGGEPFLRKDIFLLMDHILMNERNELIILSNGTLFTGDTLRNLHRYAKKNLTIQISLEGPDPEINDAVRGQGSFEKAVHGIKNLIKIGFKPIVTSTLSMQNKESLIDMPPFLKKLGVRHHHVLWLQNRGRAATTSTELEVPPEEVTRIMKGLIERSKQYGVIVDNEGSLSLRTRSKRGRKQDLCNSCYEMLSIDSDGQIYPCAPLIGEETLSLGSFKQSRLKDIWINSQVAKKVRENTVADKEGCMECYLRFICGGGCYCQSYYSTLSMGKPDIKSRDPYCRTYFDLYHDILWKLAKADDQPEGYGFNPPRVLASMDDTLPSCAVSTSLVRDFDFEVGTFHCTCVLGVELNDKDQAVKRGRNRLVKEACFNERTHEYLEWLHSPIGRSYTKLAKEKIYSLLDLKKGDKVLEVGCGTGNYTIDLINRGAQVTGLDASEWMLRLTLKKAGQEGLSFDPKHDFVERLPFPDETFDRILCMNMLEYPPDPQRAITEMLRVLKKDGLLVLGVLNKKSLWGYTRILKKKFGKDAYHEANFYSLKELRTMLIAGGSDGIKAQSTIYFPPLNNKAISRTKPLFEKLGSRIAPHSGALLLIRTMKK